MNKFLLPCLVLATALYSDDEQTHKEIAWLPKGVQQQKETTTIQRIVLSTNQTAFSEMNEKPIQIVGVQLPGPFEELEKRLQPFVGEFLSKKNLTDIKMKILAFYSDYNHSIVAVEVPPQKVENGTVNFIVVEPTIDKISFSGNRWVPNSALSETLGVSSGDKVNEKELLNNLAWINRSPFIHTDVIFSKGHGRNTTNLEFVTVDHFPLRVWAGADDTGSNFTEKDRFFTGFNLSLGLQCFFTYQFTSSTSFPDFLSHYGNFTTFFPWKHQAIFYGAYASIHPEMDDFESHGHDAQGSFRYIIPLNALYKPFQQQFLFGYDYKQVDSSLFFLGQLSDGSTTSIPVSAKRSDVSQFYLGYQIEDFLTKHHITFNLETYFSPFTWLPHQNHFDYNQLREGAKTRYIYGRLTAGEIYTLPKKFEIAGLLRLQASSSALLPSEQFGLGGFDTVRGYQEREFLADDALVANLEVRSPPLSPLSKPRNELRFLVFTDYAWGHNLHRSFAEGSTAQLWSVGPGFRYSILPYLTTRLDYGFRLHKTVFGKKGLGRFHFSAIVSY